MNYKSQQLNSRAGQPEYVETTSTGKHGADAGTTSPRMHCSRIAQGPLGYVVVGGANFYSFNIKENANSSNGPPTRLLTGKREARAHHREVKTLQGPNCGAGAGRVRMLGGYGRGRWRALQA